MKRPAVLLTLLLAPALLAPVRLKDSTPGFFMPPAESPAPESYSLPAADALTTPTVIHVSPTFIDPSPTAPVTPTSLNLPLPPSPTAPVTKIIYVQQAPANQMSPLAAALCQKGMDLVQQLAFLSYQQRRSQAVMTLALAAASAQGEAAGQQWPNLTAFNHASSHLPWFGQPQKAEIEDAATAARRLCQP